MGIYSSSTGGLTYMGSPTVLWLTSAWTQTATAGRLLFPLRGWPPLYPTRLSTRGKGIIHFPPYISILDSDIYHITDCKIA